MLRINRSFALLLSAALLVSACQPIQPVTPGSEAASAPAAQEPAPQPHQSRPDAPPYGVRGPYAVGVRDFVIEDPERPLPVTVWYPAQKSGNAEEAIIYVEHYAPLFPDMSFAGQAIRDAAPDISGEPYPLVVFSHGNSFSRLQSVYLTEQLASYGFVVVAADHTGNNLAKLGEDFWPWYAYRPLDIKRVIAYADALTAPAGALGGLIDTERIATLGHSFGASTALRAAGARLNVGWCTKKENLELEKSFNGYSCEPLVNNQAEIAKLAGVESVPQGAWPVEFDPRVDAVVALAPDYEGWGSDYEGVAAIAVPALIMAGTRDSFNPVDYAAYPIYAHLGSQNKALITLANADHLVFANACHASPAFATPDWYFVCSDPVWDMDRVHDLINHFVTAFLLAELKGDAAAAAALAPENVAFPGIQVETTTFAK